MPKKEAEDNPQIVVSPAKNGQAFEADKKPLTSDEEEEEEGKTGDPIPEWVQAVICLSGIVAGVLLIMGLFSSEWVFAVGGFYWQGLFVYCVGRNFNATTVGELDEVEVIEGCRRLDLENQAYTLGVAFCLAVSLSTDIFATMLVLLGLWVRDLDSKIKSFRLAFYLMAVSILTATMALIGYRTCFGDVIEDNDPLGPFKDPDSDWEFGWPYNACCAASVFLAIGELMITYSLCVMPVPEEEVEEEDEEAK